MDYVIRPVKDADAEAVVAVINFFVANSMASYNESPVDRTFYHRLKSLAGEYPFYVLLEPAGRVVGFALIRPYHPASTLRRTAEITYFLLPEHTGKGFGGRLLGMLENEARRRGIDTILANISSHNEQSLAFHAGHGFTECGRFRRAGRKFEKDFDIVWMQKFL